MTRLEGRMHARKQDIVEITGEIRDLIFQDPESHFTVARVVLTEGGDQEVKVVGRMPGILPGEQIRTTGYWKENARYGGRDFQVEGYEVTEPQDVLAIRRYLASGMVEQIGPKMAERLVERFGVRTLDVIEQEPHRLRDVPGIGPTRAAAISEAWKKQRKIKTIMVFLHGLGVSSAFAAKIYKKYGDRAEETIRTNPYVLTEIDGIGFIKADQVARNMGVAVTSARRVQAGVVYSLKEATDGGHCFLPPGALHSAACKILKVDVELVDAAVRALGKTKRLELVMEGGDLAGVYLSEMRKKELEVARLTVALSGAKSQPVELDRTAAESGLGVALSDEQWEAVKVAVGGRVTVITGGPGTGKTTIIRAVLNVLKQNGGEVLMAAPTGRAAKRMEETTDHPAETIHRLLKFSPDQGWRRNQDNPLGCRTLILDEVSMVDLELAYRVLSALRVGTRLVLVGDVDQLPSVGAGAFLRDVIDSTTVRVCWLRTIFRQAQGSLIVTNAHLVNAGEKMQLEPGPGQNRDLEYVEAEEPEEVLDAVMGLLRELRDQGRNLLADVQVLTPMHRGPIGTAGLNEAMQAALNRDGQEAMKRQGGLSLRVGDRVMQMRNDYDLQVFNGDVGRVASVEAKPYVLRVQYPDQLVEYGRTQAWNLVLAYAATIHKSQGSEYPVVILVLHRSHFVMLARNLFYTGLTRGKEQVYLVGQRRAIGRAVSNASPVQRHTRLRNELLAARGGLL